MSFMPNQSELISNLQDIQAELGKERRKLSITLAICLPTHDTVVLQNTESRHTLALR